MKKTLLLLIAVLLVLTSCTSENDPDIVPLPDSDGLLSESGDGEEASGILGDFSATELYGDAIDESLLSDYDLTMVNVWATYCGPCLREMPDLGELADEYGEKGVQIVGMISDVLDSYGDISESQVSVAKDIVTKTEADYPHILPSRDLFGLLYQITSVPTTFFVDKDGRQVGGAYVGSRSKAEWAKIIDETLEEVSK